MRKFKIQNSKFKIAATLCLCASVAILVLGAARPGANLIRWLTLQGDADGAGNSFTNLARVVSSNGNFQIITGPATNQFGSGGGGGTVTGIETNSGSGVNNRFTNTVIVTAPSIQATNLSTTTVAGITNADLTIAANSGGGTDVGRNLNLLAGSSGFGRPGSVLVRAGVSASGAPPLAEFYTGYTDDQGPGTNIIGHDYDFGGGFHYIPRNKYIGTNQFEHFAHFKDTVGVKTNNPGPYALNVYGAVNATGGFYSNGVPIGFGGGSGGSGTGTNGGWRLSTNELVMETLYTNTSTTSNIWLRLSVNVDLSGYVELRLDYDQDGNWDWSDPLSNNSSGLSPIWPLSAIIPPGCKYQVHNDTGTSTIEPSSTQLYYHSFGSGGGSGGATTIVNAGGGTKVTQNTISDYTVHADTNVIDSRALIFAAALTNDIVTTSNALQVQIATGAGANSNAYVAAGGGILITTNLAGQKYTAHLNTNVVFGLIDVWGATGTVAIATSANNVSVNVTNAWKAYAAALAAGNTNQAMNISNSIFTYLVASSNAVLTLVSNRFQRIPTNAAVTGYVLSATGNDAKWEATAATSYYATLAMLTGPTAATALASYATLPNTLYADGKSLDVIATGSGGGSGTRTLSLTYGTNILISQNVNSSFVPWILRATIIRTSANRFSSVVSYTGNGLETAVAVSTNCYFTPGGFETLQLDGTLSAPGGILNLYFFRSQLVP